MDEKKPEDNQAPASQPQGNVMDVQAPKQTEASQTPPVAAPAQEQPAETEPEQTPPATGPSPGQGLSPEHLAEAQKEVAASSEAKSDSKQQAHDKKGKKGPKLVIVIAVIVALALAGAAVYAYVASQDKTDPAPTETTETQQTTEEETQTATKDEVDQAAKELDSVIEATDEAEEIPEGGVNEEAVGL